MKTVVSSLYELQKVELLSEERFTDATSKIREQIPVEVLDVFDRFRERGRKAVAMVRHSVCGECHLRVPVGTLVDVMHGEIQRCGNCGRFLYIPEDAALTVSTSSSAPAAEPAPTTRRPSTRGRRKRVEPTAQAA